MATKPQYDKDLFLRESESKELIPIPKSTVKDAEKRLGVWSTCDGTWSKEVKLWREYSREFSLKVKYARLSRSAGYLAYHSMWLARFRYSASVISYSGNQLREIQSSVIGACLTAAGYSQKLPRAVVYGPKLLGGLDWDNIVVLSLFEKLKLLIGSVRINDKVGQMIRIQLTWVQLFAGGSIPLLQSKKKLRYLPVGWITNLHHLLIDTGVQVELSTGWLPTIQRQEDRILMDLVYQLIPEWAWAGINRCRLFVQATTVTDITTLDGKYIPSIIRNVKKPLRSTKLKFPFQQKPNKVDIEQWSFFIQQISANGHLFTPLGPWVRTPDQKFSHVINTEHTTIYAREKDTWKVFLRKSTQSRRFQAVRLVVHSLPLHHTPVQVISTSRYIVAREDSSTQPVPAVMPLYDQRKRYIEQQVLGTFHVNSDGLDRLQEEWQQQECRLVCATDGGLKDCIGSSSYAFFFQGIVLL